MTIKLCPTASKPKHKNPDLLHGQTYRIIGAGSPSYQEYVDRYFVRAYCGDRAYLVYLTDTLYGGGYDRECVIEAHGLEFVQVDLVEA
ncbi:hypothetical protein [Pectobacterium phage Ekidair]|nr:hypothetical protein [Pectobacterium phage Ekidair]